MSFMLFMVKTAPDGSTVTRWRRKSWVAMLLSKDGKRLVVANAKGEPVGTVLSCSNQPQTGPERAAECTRNEPGQSKPVKVHQSRSKLIKVGCNNSETPASAVVKRRGVSAVARLPLLLPSSFQSTPDSTH
jgi:hypothetical protein